jgi:hypothetical protein
MLFKRVSARKVKKRSSLPYIFRKKQSQLKLISPALRPGSAGEMSLEMGG